MSKNIRKLISETVRECLNEQNNSDSGNMELINSKPYYGIAGGTMGTVSRKYVAGTKNIYKKGKYEIQELIPRSDLKQPQDITYFISGFDDDSVQEFTNKIDWDKVKEVNNDIREKEVSIIKSTDISNAISYMKKNEKGFNDIMSHLQKEGYSKAVAFLITVRDYYGEGYPTIIFNPEVISKIMWKYGYDVMPLKEIRKLMNDKYGTVPKN